MQYQQYQQLIDNYITSYKNSDGKAANLYRKAKDQIDLYQDHLVSSGADQQRINWVHRKKEQLIQIKQGKIVVKDIDKAKQIIKVIDNDINGRLDDIMINTQKAIQASTYIRIELDRQIEALDELQGENKEFKKRMKKVKKGLQVIIRRAMLNKVTRFLMVLVLLAVIGLIVVTILKDNGIIS